MQIRDYMPGEEAILRDVFLSSVHQLARPYYTDEQINAWAPAAYDRMRRFVFCSARYSISTPAGDRALNTAWSTPTPGAALRWPR